MAKKMIQLRSNVVTDKTPKLPTVSQLEYGEFAINYADGYETIAIKNSNNEIVTFTNDEYWKTKLQALQDKIPQMFAWEGGDSFLYDINGSTSRKTATSSPILVTENLTSMDIMFGANSNVTSINISWLNTENVTSFTNMFRGCTSLVYLNLSNFDMSKCTSSDMMFNSCTNLSTINVTNCSEDTKAKLITQLAADNLGTWEKSGDYLIAPKIVTIDSVNFVSSTGVSEEQINSFVTISTPNILLSNVITNLSDYTINLYDSSTSETIETSSKENTDSNSCLLTFTQNSTTITVRFANNGDGTYVTYKG